MLYFILHLRLLKPWKVLEPPNLVFGTSHKYILTGVNSISTLLYCTVIAVMNLLYDTLILFLPFQPRGRKAFFLQPSASDMPASQEAQLPFFPDLIILTDGQRTMMCSNPFILSQQTKTFVLLVWLRQKIMSARLHTVFS